MCVTECVLLSVLQCDVVTHVLGYFVMLPALGLGYSVTRPSAPLLFDSPVQLLYDSSVCFVTLHPV